MFFVLLGSIGFFYGSQGDAGIRGIMPQPKKVLFAPLPEIAIFFGDAGAVSARVRSPFLLIKSSVPFRRLKDGLFSYQESFASAFSRTAAFENSEASFSGLMLS